MESSPLDGLPPERLARLLSVEEGLNWGGEDVRAILRHQLAAPLFPDLGIVPGVEIERLKALAGGREGTESFGGQLMSVKPSVELLEAIKQFAKQVREDGESPLRGPAATVLYYAAIAAALVKCGKRITQLSDGELREGFQWAKGCAGAEELGHLFKAAMERVPMT